MTRKHFEAIAKDIAARRNRNEAWVRAELDGLAEQLAYTFAQTNPNFDRARFLRACRGE